MPAAKFWLLVLWSFTCNAFPSTNTPTNPEADVFVSNSIVNSEIKHAGSPAPPLLISRAPSTQWVVKPYRSQGQVFGYYLIAKIHGLDFKLLFDTGSSALWTASTQMTQKAFSGTTKYPWTKEDDCAERFKEPYMDGTEVVGVEKVETITIGTSTSIPSFRFIVAEDVNDKTAILSQWKLDGMVGADLTSEIFTSSRQFSLDFNPTGDSVINSGDQLDDSKTLKMLPMVSNQDGIWLVALPESGFEQVVIDSGTTTLDLPAAFLKNYLKGNTAEQRNGGVSWWIHCDETLPDLKIAAPGGGTISIPGSRLLLTRNLPTSQWCQTLLDEAGDYVILGVPFVEQYIVHFDRLHQTVGLEEKH